MVKVGVSVAQPLLSRTHPDGAFSGQLTQPDQFILSKAFRGEVVPQDPNEPASELLDRIRASREKLAPTKEASKKKQSNKEVTSKGG